MLIFFSCRSPLFQYVMVYASITADDLNAVVFAVRLITHYFMFTTIESIHVIAELAQRESGFLGVKMQALVNLLKDLLFIL